MQQLRSTVLSVILVALTSCAFAGDEILSDSTLAQTTSQPTTREKGDDEPTTPPSDSTTSRPSDEKNGSTSGEKSGDSAEPALEAAPEIPYELGEWHTYHWMRDGEKAATSTIRFDRVAEKRNHVRLSRTFEYRVSGRYIHVQDDSLLDSNLRPVQSVEVHKTAANEMGGVTTVTTEFEPGLALVTFKSETGPHKEPRLHEVDLDDEVFLYPKYSFLAELSMIFQENGDGTYALFCPYDAKVYKAKVKKVRTETHEGAKLTRWSIEHPLFKGEFWLTETGELEKYRQEARGTITEVVRVP